MKLEFNELYVNKTWRYLAVSLKSYGIDFTERFDPLFKLAVGVGDSNLERAPILERKRPLFIMFDKEFNSLRATYFLNWVKYQSYYITDYCPDVEIGVSRRHVVVIDMPGIHEEAYDFFLKGQYSMMYSRSEIDFLFPTNHRKKEHDILIKTPEAFKEHLKVLKIEFNVIPKKEEIKEYELPPKRKEEIFFYTGDKIYF